MEKNTRKSGPDLLALAMRRARDDVAAGRVPKRPPGGETQKPDKDSAGSTPGNQGTASDSAHCCSPSRAGESGG